MTGWATDVGSRALKRAGQLDQDGQVRPLPLTDLATLVDAGVTPPAFVADGYLYRGCIHSLTGPPDAGKTTLLIWWALRVLADGHGVILLDQEAGREQTAEKFRDLGARPEDLARLAYCEFPSRRWDTADRAGLRALLADVRPALVGLDSLAAFMAAAGLDENSAHDVTRFSGEVLGPAAREHGAAVVALDHVVKSEAGGRYARGSGAKLAAVDVAWQLEPIRPFSRHQPGLLRLKHSKDRRGHLHRSHEIRVDIADGRLALRFQTTGPAVADSDGLPPAAVKVRSALRAAGRPLTTREIGDAVVAKYGHGLKRTTISEALNHLAEAGQADGAVVDTRGTKQWWAVPRSKAAAHGACRT